MVYAKIGGSFMAKKELSDLEIRNLKEAAHHISEASNYLCGAGQPEIAAQLQPIVEKMLHVLRTSKAQEPKWEDIPVSPGKPMWGKRLTPRPVGPYLVTDQFDPKDYGGMTMKKVISDHADKLSNDLPESLGTVGYAFGPDQRLSKVFYFYDTSD